MLFEVLDFGKLASCIALSLSLMIVVTTRFLK